MDVKFGQRYCIKFCVKNEISVTETLKMLEKCFGDAAMKLTAVREWHGRFKSGRKSVEDDECCGRPSTSKTDKNVKQIKERMTENRKLTIREIAEDLNIAYGSVQDILVNDLGLRRVAAKLVPKDLNFMQKLDRVDVAKDSFSRLNPTQHSSNESLLETRRGFTSTTRNPDIKRVNGVHRMSRDRKNHVVFSRKRRRCSQFSSITRVLCIMNSFHKARPSTKNIIWEL